MKLWLDDVRPAPEGYIHCHSVNEAIKQITIAERERSYAKDSQLPNRVKYWTIELIDCDHDLGDYANDGGDGIKLLDWLVEHSKFYPIKLHTMNPVGRENMQRMIDRYWTKTK